MEGLRMMNEDSGSFLEVEAKKELLIGDKLLLEPEHKAKLQLAGHPFLQHHTPIAS
jgi:hypothetical protein